MHVLIFHALLCPSQQSDGANEGGGGEWNAIKAAIPPFLATATQARSRLADKAGASARAMHSFAAGGASKPENNVWTCSSSTTSSNNPSRTNAKEAGGHSTATTTSTTEPKHSQQAKSSKGTHLPRQHPPAGMVPVQVMMMRMSTTTASTFAHPQGAQRQRRSRFEGTTAAPPLCKFGRSCSRPNCHFQHPERASAAAHNDLPSSASPGGGGGGSSQTSTVNQRGSTQRRGKDHHHHHHPSQVRFARPCRYGDKCRRAGCSFEHPRSAPVPTTSRKARGAPASVE